MATYEQIICLFFYPLLHEGRSKINPAAKSMKSNVSTRSYWFHRHDQFNWRFAYELTSVLIMGASQFVLIKLEARIVLFHDLNRDFWRHWWTPTICGLVAPGSRKTGSLQPNYQISYESTNLCVRPRTNFRMCQNKAAISSPGLTLQVLSCCPWRLKS